MIHEGWIEGIYVTEIGNEEIEKNLIETMTLDEILRFTFGKIYVKIDIEGTETAILESSKHLEKINELEIETHNNNKILTRMLSEKNFSIYINKYKINITLSRI